MLFNGKFALFYVFVNFPCYSMESLYFFNYPCYSMGIWVLRGLGGGTYGRTDVWKFTPVSYRTSVLRGRCPNGEVGRSLGHGYQFSPTPERSGSFDNAKHNLLLYGHVFCFKNRLRFCNARWKRHHATMKSYRSNKSTVTRRNFKPMAFQEQH